MLLDRVVTTDVADAVGKNLLVNVLTSWLILLYLVLRSFNASAVVSSFSRITLLMSVIAELTVPDNAKLLNELASVSYIVPADAFVKNVASA